MKSTCGIISLLLLLLLLLQPAAAQQTTAPPACPITEPVFRYYASTGGALPDIPSSGNAVIMLDSDGIIHHFDSVQTVASGQVICIVTSGVNMVRLFTAASRHIVLEAGGWLHLDNVWLNVNMWQGGGVSTGPPYGNRKLTTNNVVFEYCEDSAIHATTALTAHLHDTTFTGNSGQNGAGIYVLLTDAGGSDTAVLKFSGTTQFQENIVSGAGPTAGLGGAMYLGSHTTAAQLRVQVVFATSSAVFTGNAARAGGAIFVDGGVDLRFQGGSCFFGSIPGVFLGNYAYGAGNIPANKNAVGAVLMVMNTETSKPALSYVELGCDVTTLDDNYATANTRPLKAQGAAVYLAAPTAGDRVVVDFPGRTTTAITNNGVVQSATSITGGAVSIHSAGEVRVNAKCCLWFAGNQAYYLPANVVVEGIDIGITTESSGVASISVGRPTGSLRFLSSGTSNVALAGAGSIQCGSNTPKSAGNFFFQCNMCDATCNNVTTGGGTCNACGSSALICPSPPGCSTPPPIGGPNTLITGYSSCSAPVSSSDGTYPITTSCQATCQGAATGGFATCGLDASRVPSWQLRGCQADCSGNPLAVPGVVWSCGASTVAGGSCKAACSVADGFAGGPVTAVCLSPAWSNTTIGSCKRVACIGPPLETPPYATFPCTSTPVGEPCRAVCLPGLTGSLRRTCLADGTFAPLEGDPCVDCISNKPQLEAVGATAPSPAGTTVLSATFTFTARYVQGTTKLTPTLDGQTTGCTAKPAQVNGPQVAPASITVSCQAAAGSSISARPHTIGLTADFTGANGCSSGSLSALADVLVADPLVPAPVVELSAPAVSAAPACRAAAGAPTSVSAEFKFAITSAAAAAAVQLDVSDASAAGAVCTGQRTDGSLASGTIRVTCRGVFSSAVNSLAIRLTLKATTPGSLVGSATSSHTVTLVCCQNTTALAVSSAGDCLTCGASSRVEGLWLQGELLSGGVMRSGALAAVTCSSAGPDVGSISAKCDDRNEVLTVTVINPPGSSTTLQYMAKCNPVPTTPGASCGASWLTVNARRNGLQVSKTASATTIKFSISVTHSACGCRQLHYAVRQAGAFGLGACGRRF